MGSLSCWALVLSGIRTHRVKPGFRLLFWTMALSLVPRSGSVRPGGLAQANREGTGQLSGKCTREQ